jgi:ribosomal protein S18 acetylase RimI-like enzyme
MFVRALTAADQPWKLATLEQDWGATTVARLGQLIDAATLPGFVSVDGDERIGLLTYIERADGIEVTTIRAVAQGRGVGRALMDAVYEHAVQRGAPRLWLITTNDNFRAFAFYQQWGYGPASRGPLRGGFLPSGQAVDPHDGGVGIPVRHELEFERVVTRP